MAVSQRSRVITLYKNLLYLGRDYPQGYDFFRSKCHAAFLKNRDIEEDKVRALLILYNIKMMTEFINLMNRCRLKNGSLRETISSKNWRLSTC